MAVISSQSIPTNGSTKDFQILGDILSKSHMGVWLNTGSGNVWQGYDKWDRLGSVILFKNAPVEGTLLINVYDTSEEVPTEPDAYAVLSTLSTEIARIFLSIDNIDAVGNNGDNIDTVAGLETALIAVITEPLRQSILDAETNANDAEDAWNDFRTRYYGISSSDPVTDPLGNAMGSGDIYFNITTNRMKVYTGVVWIDAGTSINGMIEYVEFVASAGQDTFTGLTYDVGYVNVYRNGYRLPNSDFTATTGTSIVLGTPANLNDDIIVEAFGAFDSGQLANILSDIDTLESDMALVEGDITTLQSNLSTTNTNVGNNTTDISGLDTRVGDSETDISAIDNRVTAVEGDLLNRHGADTTTPIVTINVDPAKYDVKAFNYILDGDEYSQAITSGATHDMSAGQFRILYVDGTGTVKTQSTFLTAGEVGTKMEIGRIASDDGTNITSIGDSAFIVGDFMKNVYARWKFFEGTKFGQNAGLITEYAVGQLQADGGYISDNNGNIEVINSEIELDVFPVYTVAGSTGIRPLVANMIVPDTQYDNGTDLALIPNNKFVAHTLLRSMGTSRYYLEYGRIVYNSLIEAQLGITENNIFSQDSSEVEPLARVIVLENQGIADIRDVRGQPSAQSSSVLNVLGWKDLVSPFIAGARGGVISEPSWDDIGNGIIMTHWVAGDELPVAFHVDHDYALETPAFPHVHFFAKDAQAQSATITWRFSYVIAKGHSQGESLTGVATDIDFTYTYTGSEVAGEHIIVECADIDAFVLIEPDTVILAQVTLLSENLAGDIVGIMADLHYQSDRETTPFKEPNFLTGV